MSPFTYLALNLGTISIPFIYSFHPRLRFKDKWGAFAKSSALSAGFFLAWDILYTHLGVWGFNERYLIGISLFGLPLEEWLFFLCIPYACVFTYYCLGKIIPPGIFQKNSNAVTIFLFFLFFLTLGLNIGKLYTSATVLLALALLALTAGSDLINMTRFYLSFAVLLIPFLLVNGILTGSFLDEPVVWYNDQENLGIRFFTIPLDDFIYAFAMILMNIYFFEFFQARVKRSELKR